MVDPIAYIRKLTVLLVVSGTLNIVLAFFIFYGFIKETPPTPYFELKPANRQEQQPPLALDHTDSEIIRYFRRMPLEWLISRLNNAGLVENGYTQRDLALASLVAFHYFDLERAFLGLPTPKEKRLIAYGKFQDGRPAEITVYPGLSDHYFAAVQQFAATERWPLTARGLFLALQKEEREEDDPNLLDAFFITSEFASVEMLFNRSDVEVKKKEILRVLLEGNWTLLSEFSEQQRTSQDLSQAHRQAFLLKYVDNGSKAATQLLLKTDGVFAARKLDDRHVISLLNLAEEKSPQSEQFALTLLTSPRSDAVWKLAARRLYEYVGEVVQEPYNRQAALVRFAPQNAQEAPLSNSALKETKPAISNNQPIRKTTPTPTASASKIASIPGPISQKPAEKVSPPKSLSVPAKKTTPVATLNKIPSPQPAKRDFYYTVQEGDTLWKIARRFSVDIEVLRAFNQLDTDALHPGKKLRIPASK
jgi:LysM repeat protein